MIQSNRRRYAGRDARFVVGSWIHQLSSHRGFYNAFNMSAAGVVRQQNTDNGIGGYAKHVAGVNLHGTIAEKLGRFRTLF